MKIEALHIGMNIRHPEYGSGVVKTISEHGAGILFTEGLKTLDPVVAGIEPLEEQATISGLTIPLDQFIAQTTQAVVKELGLEKPDQTVDQLGQRWQGGKLVLHPADASLQVKEVPLETFFHKIVMIRNNLRVLEQKINSHEKNERWRKSRDAAIYQPVSWFADHLQPVVQNMTCCSIWSSLQKHRSSRRAADFF